MYSINCRGKLIELDKPVVMGIINATPDSFFEGHLQKGLNGIVELANTMARDGASILDIGGQSTRPGSQRVGANEEMDRVIPVIKAILLSLPDAVISIDTYHASVAEAAIGSGASIVNDISGGNMDEQMLSTVARLQCPYICMHMKGTPETMQASPQYEDVVKEVLDFFIWQVDRCRKAGIKDIIIDPGFGFGKSIEHNFALLKHLSVFSILNVPLLAGLSRKSTIYKTLGVTVDQALNGTTVLNTIAVMNGASILRVHDVKEAAELVKLYKAVNN